MAHAIRRLTPEDAFALARLRRESLENDPRSFGATSGDDPHGSEDAFRLSLARVDELAAFGAFGADGELVGIVGLTRSPKGKRRHTATVFGLYTAPAWRRRGLARRLLEQVIGLARQWPGVEQVKLSVTTAAPGARRLYEDLGFRQWGLEPRAILWGGRYEDEVYLGLDLTPKRP